VAALLDGRVCAVDVGWIEYRGPDGRAQRGFVNAADVGIGAVAAARINRSSKLLGGFLTYLVGAARTIVTAHPRLARVVVDGGTGVDGPVQMILIANGAFHAGGMRMAPGASLTDGQFDVLVLQGVPRTALLGAILPRAYRGTHIRHPAIMYRRGREVAVSADEPLLFEMDGESPGTTDLTARVLPGALRVRVPHAA
jgi:diacylglycerol kinase family enzyme